MAELVSQAYVFADECHRGQTRVSGEPYIAHPLETALFLADLHLDAHTLIAALLHDVVEDCGITLEELDARFGHEVTKLVEQLDLTKLSRDADDKLKEQVREIVFNLGGEEGTLLNYNERQRLARRRPRDRMGGRVAGFSGRIMRDGRDHAEDQGHGPDRGARRRRDGADHVEDHQGQADPPLPRD